MFIETRGRLRDAERVFKDMATPATLLDSPIVILTTI